MKTSVYDPSQSIRPMTWALLGFLVVPSLLWGYSGGKGTRETPYQLRRPQDIVQLSQNEDHWDQHFILTKDISLSGRFWEDAVIEEFSGTLEGRGYVIKNLRIDGRGEVGLIGQLMPGALVSTLGLVNAEVRGSNDKVGSLVAVNTGTVKLCYSTGTVTGRDYTGGLVGINLKGFIRCCFSTAAVMGHDKVGGLVGQNGECASLGKISSCYSTGDVSASWGSAGGLIGYNSGEVIHSYSTSRVLDGKLVGGFIADEWRYCEFYPIVSACYWDRERSGLDESRGGLGLTSAEMTRASIYRSNGWDFWAEPYNGLHETWVMPDEPGPPVLSILSGYEPPDLPGNGTAKSPYRIGTAAELAAVFYYPYLAVYQLERDINLTGIYWSDSVVDQFGGTWYGQGHTVAGLRVHGTSYQGLIGRVAVDAWVEEIGLINADVWGLSDCIGTLAASNEGVIRACLSHGTVSGRKWIGGFVGHNVGGSIEQCYSQVRTHGTSRIGGLVGLNGYIKKDGQVVHCYSTGKVTGKSNIGGLVGEDYRGDIIQSFWDIETSERDKSQGGAGLTTQAMMDWNTFRNADWDLVGESANGREDFWFVDNRKDYPRLSWE